MDVPVLDPALQLPAHSSVSAARSSSPAYIAALQEQGLTTTNGAADSAYRTAYDHYMIEREARAYRRAYVWSMLATVVRNVRQSLSNSRLRQA